MFLTIEASAQRSYKGDDDSKTFRERIYVGAYINSPFLGATAAFGNVFSVGVQPFAGYKWNNFISSGLTVSYDYTLNWFPGGSQGSNSSRSFSDVGVTTFTRATIAQTFIFQIEGGFYSLEVPVTAFDTERRSFPVALVGGGYTNGAFEILLTYEFLGNLGLFQIPIDYKGGIVYHF